MRRAGRRKADEIDVVVEAAQWRRTLPGAATLAARAARAALRRAAPGGGEACAVLLADDATVRDLNRRYRQQDKPTNVLSFALQEGEATPAPPGLPRPLGDVVLAYETVAHEAGQQGKPLAHHLAHLTVHGVLHLLGHDHRSDREAEAMEALETEILAELGVPDPYAAPYAAGLTPGEAAR